MGPTVGDGCSNVVAGVAYNVMLAISANDWMTEHVDLSWTYRRPVRGHSDELHQPQRTVDEARNISQQFYDEINNPNAKLASPFKNIYNEEAMTNHRLFNWLMKSVRIPQVVAVILR